MTSITPTQNRVNTSISTAQRFRRFGLQCPICSGHAGLKQGRRERCAGYLSSDGEYAYCTREEFSGNLSPNGNTTPPTFCHKLYGECNCGKIHNPAHTSNGHKPKEKKQSQASSEDYSYLDEHGRLAYVTVRYEPKDFKQKRPDRNGGWIWNLQGMTRIPYRLPELLKAPLDAIVYICEGEKAVEAARHLGVVATTNVGGAGNWTPSCNKYFKGRHVVILPDNDDKGKCHAKKVAKELIGIAASVRIVELPGLPEKGDIVEWITAGGTKEELERLTKPPKRKFVYASEIEEQPIEWLWKRRIARGCFTLMVGDPGLGKSSIIAKIIATVTNGGGLPDGNKIEPGGVILMSPEDSASKTIVPRLRAAGANLKKVLLLTEVEDFDGDGNSYMRPVSFPEDAHILEEAIEDIGGASLAIIDPVLSMLSGKVDAHKDHAVRQALARVISVAEKHDCALLGVAHLNKGQNTNALYRSSSSIAFIAMARTGLFVVPDPDNESGGVIVNHKNNLAPKAISLRYRFQQTSDEIGYITWEGESTYSEIELLNQVAPTNNKRSEQADNLVSVLKEHEEAMTPEEIHPLLTTSQTLSALKMMLSRKVDNGEIMRVARGKYTYLSNPQYSVNEVTSVVNVNNVNNVNNDSEVEINKSNINNTTFDCYIAEESSPSLNGANGHQKRNETDSISRGKRIAMMQSQGILYPKKCKDSTHRGITRWLPRENPDTNQWEWYCCQCEMEA